MTGIEKNKFHYFLLYLKIKKKKNYLEKMALDLAGQLNECTVTENHVLVFVLYQKNKNQNQNIFSSLSKRNKFETKKHVSESTFGSKGTRLRKLHVFFFWTELCKQSILRASNSVNSLTNNWILRKFRTLKAELERWSLKFSLVLLRSAY